MIDDVATTYQLLDRNLGLDLMRVTEAAAMAAGRWAGKGDKESGDKAAVDQMRLLLASVPFRGVVVIGEGEKDEARCCTTAKCRSRYRAGVRRRRRPGRRHQPAGQGNAERAGDDRHRRAGRNV